MTSSTLVIALFALLGLAQTAAADTTLAGLVTSAEEGAMKGVVVSAHRQGSSVTVSR